MKDFIPPARFAMKAGWAALALLALASCSSDTGEGPGFPDVPVDAPPDTAVDGTIDNGSEIPTSSDSDGDTIPDVVEGASSARDTDGDGTPDYLDLDADGDTLPDEDEGMTDPDGDALPSCIDFDSDGDGLRDADEVEAGTAPYDPDSDDDGASDLVETVAGTDPLDVHDNPRIHGDFIFVVPYDEAPEPGQDTLVFETSLQKADVYFLIDTSASMGGEIDNLRDTLTSTIVPRVRDTIPDVWIGAGIFDHCPALAHCTESGTPVGIRNLQRLDADAELTRAALGTITGITCNGAYEPYIGSLWLTATGDTSPWPRLDPRDCSGHDEMIGYPCFREGSIPIIVQFGDEGFYGQSYKNDCADFPRYEEMIDALDGIHAQYIGIASGSGMWDSNGMQDTCNDTGSVDISGSPLAYRISGDGTGLGDQVIEAIHLLATQVPIDVGTDAADRDDGPEDGVDATVFIDRIVPNTAGGVADPVDPLVVCVGGLETADADGDGVPEKFTGVLPGTAVCFDIFPRMNTSVPPADDPKLLSADVQVLGNDVTVLDTRTVFFLVPPDTSSVGPQ